MELVEVVRPLRMPFLVEQTIPIGVGIAVTSAFREPILARLPKGVVGRLGRMATATVDAMIGAATCLLAWKVVPEQYKQHAFLAGATSFAFAGYDALKALLGTGGLSRVEITTSP